MKKYIILTLIAVILIIFGISFVDYNDSNSTSIVLDDSISYGVEDIPKDLKRVLKLNSSDLDIFCAVTKGLVEEDSEGKVVPSLAYEINKSDDGIQYEFKIRDDVYWSNGEKVTAKDVVTFFKEFSVPI